MLSPAWNQPGRLVRPKPHIITAPRLKQPAAHLSAARPSWLQPARPALQVVFTPVGVQEAAVQHCPSPGSRLREVVADGGVLALRNQLHPAVGTGWHSIQNTHSQLALSSFSGDGWGPTQGMADSSLGVQHHPASSDGWPAATELIFKHSAAYPLKLQEATCLPTPAAMHVSTTLLSVT